VAGNVEDERRLAGIMNPADRPSAPGPTGRLSNLDPQATSTTGQCSHSDAWLSLSTRSPLPGSLPSHSLRLSIWNSEFALLS